MRAGAAAGRPAGRDARRALSYSDEFFALVDSPRVPQHVAAVALLGPGGASTTAELVSKALADTVPDRPG